MRAKLAAAAKARQERASQVPVNAAVYTEGTNVFLGPATQPREAPTTTLPSAPLAGAGAVEAADALVKLRKIRRMSGSGSVECKAADGAHQRVQAWIESRGKVRIFSVDLGLLGEHARSQLVSGSTERRDTSAN